MTQGHFQQLIDTIQAAGYVGPDGNHLADSREWHALVQAFRAHPGWPGGKVYGGKLVDALTQVANWREKNPELVKIWNDAKTDELADVLAAKPPCDGLTGSEWLASQQGWETMESAPLDGRQVELMLYAPLRQVMGAFLNNEWVCGPGPMGVPCNPQSWRPIR